MSLHSILLILAIHAVALVSPGPDFAIVTRLSIVSGRRDGLLAGAGVVAGIGTYALVTLLGLSIVLAALPGVSRILSVVGALYLGYLGIQCLRSRGVMPEASESRHGRRAFLSGYLTNLLNPKAMLYFGSILSQALVPDLEAIDMALLWGLLVGESLLWFALVAHLFSSPWVLLRLRRHLKWFERAIGVVLLRLAARVASSATR